MEIQAVRKHIDEHQEMIAALSSGHIQSIHSIGEMISGALDNGGKLLLCGNGGSAADAQHIAAEFMVRFRRERRALPAIALTTDTSILTAGGNDYGFDSIFERQVAALGRPGDVLIGISTSGNSRNVLAAMHLARDMGLVTVSFSGESASKLRELSDYEFCSPSNVTARIQECHILAGHIICDLVDADFADDEVA